jgi:hypothetical protein
LLSADAQDAYVIRGLVLQQDSVFHTDKPYVIYDSLKVDSGARLTLLPGTTLMFHDKAGLDVYGTLSAEGELGKPVIFRGDRTDRMFPYLPYDRVSGQWQGIHIRPSSKDNYIRYADIHSSTNGIVCDSVGYDSLGVRLTLENVTIHNCKGAGLVAYNSNVNIVNSQITNTLGDCVAIYGGRAFIVYSTLAQFYPFDANRGVALRFANYDGKYNYPLYMFECYNTLVTGYADDVIMGETNDSTVAFNYYFQNNLLRTPIVSDSIRFVNVKWETPEDSVQGKQHFVLIDEDNLIYDFHLDSLSTARGGAIPASAYCDDRNGIMRKDDAPDIGCYEYVEKDKGIN